MVLGVVSVFQWKPISESTSGTKKPAARVDACLSIRALERNQTEK